MAVSRELGVALAADDASYPWAWLQEMRRSEMVRQALRKRRRPFHVARKGCWPPGDAVFGFWIARLAARDGLNVTLVDSPMGKQLGGSSRLPSAT